MHGPQTERAAPWSQRVCRQRRGRIRGQVPGNWADPQGRRSGHPNRFGQKKRLHPKMEPYDRTEVQI